MEIVRTTLLKKDRDGEPTPPGYGGCQKTTVHQDSVVVALDRQVDQWVRENVQKETHT